MQTNISFESITFYLFQFHMNKEADSIKEFLCIPIPQEQTGL